MKLIQAAALLFLCCCFPSLWAQEKTKLDANDPAAKSEDKRVLGVLPNYRTAELTSDYHPISSKYKLTIALKDSFDYPLVGLAAAFAGLYQIEDSHPQFNQGMAGYGRRVATSYSDQVIGNMLTEGFLPVLLKADPRYFRMAEGLKSKRILYALSRIFATKTDTGARSFNYSEVIGNGVASAIALSYYQDDRNATDYLENWGTQLATDAVSQVLKEFWPDIKRRYFHKHHGVGT